MLVDEERILVRAVCGASVFDDAQTAGGDFLAGPMVNEDDAIGDKLLDAVPRQLVGAVALGRDDRGQPSLFEPAEQAPDFRAKNAGVRQLGEERFNRVEDDALGADLLAGVRDADEEAVEIVFAGFRHLGSRDVDVVEEQLLLGDELRQVEAERGAVLDEVGNRLLERHEHAGLVVLRGASHEELEAEHRLA